MLCHRDRRATRQWAKSGPPLGVARRSPPEGGGGGRSKVWARGGGGGGLPARPAGRRGGGAGDTPPPAPWGRPEKSTGGRRIAGTGNQPALRDAPTRWTSQGDHGASI